MIDPGSGAISENDSSKLTFSGAVSLPIRAVVVLSVGNAALGLQVDVHGFGFPALGLHVEVNGYGGADLPLHVKVGPTGKAIPAVLRVDVLNGLVLSGAVTAADAGSVAAAWCVVVEIDGADVSADVVGEVTVEAEESASRVADFALALPVGVPVYPTTWVGKIVRISFADFSSGAAANAILLFTGRVDVPSVQPLDALIRLRCTDDRQGVIAALSAAQVASLLPGSRWSPAVFDKGASPWVQAGDRLSTIPAALDLAPGGFPRLADWAAKTVADFTFTDGMVLDESVAVDLAERSRLTNSVDVTFGYRFPRMKAEGWLVGFNPLAQAHTSFKYWIRDGNLVLQRAAVEAALRQAGATIVSITWIALPTTAQVIPGTGGSPAGVWLPNPGVDVLYCLGFAAVVAFDYGQQIEEKHTITVACPLSVAAVGTIRETMSGAMEGVYDDIRAAEQNILLYRSSITTIPPGDMAPIAVGLTNSADVTLSSDSDRAAASAAMEVLVAIARVKIHAAHRATSVRAAIPCLPVLDLPHTVSIAAQGVTAKGKIRRLVHRLDVDAGSAISEFELAICSAAGVGITHADDPINAPAGTTPTQSALPAPTVTWNGLNGQDGVITIDFAAVAPAERDLAATTIKSSHDAPIYEDLLEITP